MEIVANVLNVSHLSCQALMLLLSPTAQVDLGEDCTSRAFEIIIIGTRDTSKWVSPYFCKVYPNPFG